MRADRKLSRVMKPIAKFGSRAYGSYVVFSTQTSLLIPERRWLSKDALTTMSTNTLSMAMWSVDVVYAYTLKLVSTTTSKPDPKSTCGAERELSCDLDLPPPYSLHCAADYTTGKTEETSRETHKLTA